MTDSPTNLGALRLLVVEDEGLVAADLEFRLERMGYLVCGIADNAEDAVSLAASLLPDVVLMDIHLIGPSDGISAAEKIRVELGVPVVFATAHADAATVGRAGRAEPYGYVIKPFEEQDLRVGIEIARYRHLAEVRVRELERMVGAAEKRAAMEAERLRIARDMHDDLGASLSSIGLMAQLMLGSLEDHSLREQTEEIRETALESLESLRDIVWAVNPQNDHFDTFVEYLAGWVHRFLSEAGIACRLDLPAELPDDEIPGNVRNALLLATKEATQNIVKHAGGSRAQFRVSQEGGEAVIAISDQGRSASSESNPRPGGQVGIASMCARLESIGGRAIVTSQPEHGTTVCFRFPLDLAQRRNTSSN